MQRYKIDIEYDGTSYCGWQKQADCPSVQGAIELAIFAFTGEKTSVKGAGRTDSGVHATGQVAHFDLSTSWIDKKIRDALNAHLQLKKEKISILESSCVSETFDARFSATQRHYIYRILDRRPPPSLNFLRVWWVRHPLDIFRMQEASLLLIGKHDFTTFRSSQCQANSPVRTLNHIKIIRQQDFIEIHVAARSFLHNQIRSIAGCLKRIGEGGWQNSNLLSALQARNRKACAPIAPACGLYLAKIDYDSEL